jgi:hypothetical protein
MCSELLRTREEGVTSFSRYCLGIRLEGIYNFHDKYTFQSEFHRTVIWYVITTQKTLQVTKTSVKNDHVDLVVISYRGNMYHMMRLVL